MPEKDEALSETEKLTALCQIQAAFYHQEHPTLRVCGLTEAVAASVANEGLVTLWLVANAKSDLDKYRVNEISEAGHGILSRGEMAELPPLRVAVGPRHESTWSKTRRALMSGLWEVIKIALGIPVGIAIGYFFWKYHWK